MSAEIEKPGTQEVGVGGAGGTEDPLARALGWFSLGLGLSEVVNPDGLARWIGVEENPALIRALGLREIASGLGILSGRQPAGWLWARVGGDAIDLALLGRQLPSANGQRGRVAAATAAVVGVTVLDWIASQRLSGSSAAATGAGGMGGAVQMKRAITINRPPEELYAFWRDFENLPRFMEHLKSVRVTGPNRSHWVAQGPAGTTVEWDAEITDDQPNERIAWRSLEGADVQNAGEVRFEPSALGPETVVRVWMEYRPPAGKLGAAVAKLLLEYPEKQVSVELHRFKQLMETGEIARTEGQPAGRGRSTSWRYDDPVRS